MNTTTLTIAIVAFLAGVGFASAIGSIRLKRQSANSVSRGWWADWLHGFSTEMGGAIVTTVLLTVVVGAVQQRENEAARKQDLILQMGSPVNDFALEAVRQLQVLGGLEDGSLQGANLMPTWKARICGMPAYKVHFWVMPTYRAQIYGMPTWRAQI
jgi:hypothetical protein